MTSAAAIYALAAMDPLSFDSSGSRVQTWNRIEILSPGFLEMPFLEFLLKLQIVYMTSCRVANLFCGGGLGGGVFLPLKNTVAATKPILRISSHKFPSFGELY